MSSLGICVFKLICYSVLTPLRSKFRKFEIEVDYQSSITHYYLQRLNTFLCNICDFYCFYKLYNLNCVSFFSEKSTCRPCIHIILSFIYLLFTMAQNVNPRFDNSSNSSPKRSEDMNDRIESNKVVQRYYFSKCL